MIKKKKENKKSSTSTVVPLSGSLTGLNGTGTDELDCEWQYGTVIRPSPCLTSVTNSVYPNQTVNAIKEKNRKKSSQKIPPTPRCESCTGLINLYKRFPKSIKETISWTVQIYGWPSKFWCREEDGDHFVFSAHYYFPVPGSAQISYAGYLIYLQ